MIGGLSALDRFLVDFEREAGTTPGRRWLEQNSAAINTAYREMMAERDRLNQEKRA